MMLQCCDVACMGDVAVCMHAYGNTAIQQFICMRTHPYGNTAIPLPMQFGPQLPLGGQSPSFTHCNILDGQSYFNLLEAFQRQM